MAFCWYDVVMTGFIKFQYQVSRVKVRFPRPVGRLNGIPNNEEYSDPKSGSRVYQSLALLLESSISKTGILRLPQLSCGFVLVVTTDSSEAKRRELAEFTLLSHVLQAVECDVAGKIY